MKQNDKIVWGVVIVTVLVVTAIVTYIILGDKNCNNDSTGEASVSSSVTAGNDSKTTVLKRGSRGSEVSNLQTFLNAKIVFYYAEKGGRPVYNGTTINSLAVDGIFGSKTEAACKWWFGTPQVSTSQFS